MNVVTSRGMNGMTRGLALTCSLALSVVACGPAESSPPGDGTPLPAAKAAPPGTPPAPAVVPTFGKAYPIDEGPRDPEFAAFRDSLLRIVARRDTGALFAIMVPEIKISFGPDNGIGEFRTHWRVSDPDSRLWVLLDDVLRHGGKFSPSGGAFYAPYTFSALPDSLDAFEYLVVRDSGVVVRERPDVASAALATLSFDIVRAGPYDPESSWRAIALVDGRIGYVEGSRIRSPVDYRAGFERREGRWRLVLFVAGD